MHVFVYPSPSLMMHTYMLVCLPLLDMKHTFKSLSLIYVFYLNFLHSDVIIKLIEPEKIVKRNRTTPIILNKVFVQSVLFENYSLGQNQGARSVSLKILNCLIFHSILIVDFQPIAYMLVLAYS
jgi:hypothetical protein